MTWLAQVWKHKYKLWKVFWIGLLLPQTFGQITLAAQAFISKINYLYNLPWSTQVYWKAIFFIYYILWGAMVWKYRNCTKNKAYSKYAVAIVLLLITFMGLNLANNASHEDAQSQFELGWNYKYDNNSNVPQNEAKAAEQFYKAAKHGHAQAQYVLATLYGAGKGVPKNHHEAFNWALKSAKQGFAPAQAMIGYAYYTGDKIEKDPVEAIKWLRLAAKNPQEAYGIAPYYLARAYITGTGVPQDNTEAIKWFHVSAEAGNEDGQYALGMIYSKGFGEVPKDDVQAYKWLKLAADQNQKSAQTILEVLVSHMSQGQIKESEHLIEEWKKSYKPIFPFTILHGPASQKAQ